MVPGERMHTRNSHGTGCSLSSAMATVQARRRGTGRRRSARSSRGCWGRCAKPRRLDVGTGNGPVHHFHHVQQHTQDHGRRTGHRRPGTGGGRVRRRAAGQPPPPTLRRSTAWTSSGPSPTGRCRSRSSPTTSPRTPCTSTAIPGSWPAPPRSPPRRPSSCSGPARRRTAWKSSRSCTGPGSAPATADATPGPVTKAYVDHLLAASVSGSYGVLVAAVLPCFWLYAEVGETLHGQFLAAGAPEAHPYAGGCAPTPTRSSPPPPGRPSRTRTRRPGGLGERAGRHGPGLPAVRPLRGRLLRRAAAARLTAGAGRACTIGGHGSGSRCGRLCPYRVAPITYLPSEPASFAAEGKISVV